MFTWLRSLSRKRRALLAILLLLVGGAGAAGAWYLRIEAHLKAAQTAHLNHDDEQSRKEIEAYLATWPRCTRARLLAAQTARRLRSYDEASDHLLAYRQ